MFNAIKPYTTYIKVFAVIALAGYIYWMNCQLDSEKTKLSDANKKIGELQAKVEEKDRQIILLDTENKRVVSNMKKSEEISAKTNSEKIAIERENSKLKLKLGVLKSENKKLKDYLNTDVPIDVVGLFSKPKEAGKNIHSEGGKVDSAKVSDSADKKAVSNHRLIEHALDLEKSLDQCISQINGIVQWSMEVR